MDKGVVHRIGHEKARLGLPWSSKVLNLMLFSPGRSHWRRDLLRLGASHWLKMGNLGLIWILHQPPVCVLAVSILISNCLLWVYLVDLNHRILLKSLILNFRIVHNRALLDCKTYLCLRHINRRAFWLNLAQILFGFIVRIQIWLGYICIALEHFGHTAE